MAVAASATAIAEEERGMKLPAESSQGVPVAYVVVTSKMKTE